MLLDIILSIGGNFQHSKTDCQAWKKTKSAFSNDLLEILNAIFLSYHLNESSTHFYEVFWVYFGDIIHMNVLSALFAQPWPHPYGDFFSLCWKLPKTWGIIFPHTVEIKHFSKNLYTQEMLLQTDFPPKDEFCLKIKAVVWFGFLGGFFWFFFTWNGHPGKYYAWTFFSLSIPWICSPENLESLQNSWTVVALEVQQLNLPHPAPGVPVLSVLVSTLLLQVAVSLVVLTQLVGDHELLAAGIYLDEIPALLGSRGCGVTVSRAVPAAQDEPSWGAPRGLGRTGACSLGFTGEQEKRCFIMPSPQGRSHWLPRKVGCKHSPGECL